MGFAFAAVGNPDRERPTVVGLPLSPRSREPPRPDRVGEYRTFGRVNRHRSYPVERRQRSIAGPVGCSVSLYGISGTSREAKFPRHRRTGRVASIAASPSCRTRPRRYSGSELLAALSVGCAIIRLLNVCRRLDLGSGLDEALEALAECSSAAAIAKLANLDDALAARPGISTLRRACRAARDLGGAYRTRRVFRRNSARMMKFPTLSHRCMTALDGNLPGPWRAREGLELTHPRHCRTPRRRSPHRTHGRRMLAAAGTAPSSQPVLVEFRGPEFGFCRFSRFSDQSMTTRSTALPKAAACPA